MRNPLHLWHKILTRRVSDLRGAESMDLPTLRAKLQHVVDLAHVGYAVRTGEKSTPPITSISDFLKKQATETAAGKTPLTTNDAGHSRRGYSEMSGGGTAWWQQDTKFKSFADHAKSVIRRACSNTGIHLPARAAVNRHLEHAFKLLELPKPSPASAEKLGAPQDEHERFAFMVNHALRATNHAHPKMTLDKYVQHRGGLSQMLADLEVALGTRDRTQNPLT